LIFVVPKNSGQTKRQVARQELEAKASKSAGENAEEAKAAADAAAAAAVAAEGAVKPDHVRIDETSYLINLIDSPGHVDFSSEVGTHTNVVHYWVCACLLWCSTGRTNQLTNDNTLVVASQALLSLSLCVCVCVVFKLRRPNQPSGK